MTKVLLVEDNEKLNDGNRRALEGEGYTVYCALTLEAARAELAKNEPDIILLDVGMPDGDGFNFCKEIRPQTKAHIIFLTARREHSELVEGLDIGGDDYIKKPFMLDELLSRVAAAARRRAMRSRDETMVIGNLKLDTIANQAYVNEISLELQHKEFQLLHYFALNQDMLLSTELVYKKIWTRKMGGDKRVVQRRVSDLRNKLIDSGCTHTVNTVYGKGYIFESKSDK